MSDINNEVDAKEAARTRLISGLKYFRMAVEDAQRQGQVQLGVMALLPNGNRQLTTAFDFEDFFNDIALVTGAPPLTDEDRAEVSALQFLAKHKIQVAE